jgi:hypothetical protein
LAGTDFCFSYHYTSQKKQEDEMLSPREIMKMRKKVGLPQWIVAAQIGRSQAWLSAVEVGNHHVDADVMKRIVAAIERCSGRKDEAPIEIADALKKYRDILERRIRDDGFDRGLSEKLDCLSVLLNE